MNQRRLTNEESTKNHTRDNLTHKHRVMCVCGVRSRRVCNDNPKDVVNARMSPSKRSQIVGTFECGETVYTDGVIKKDSRGGKWIHIWCGFEVGEAWVSKKYVVDSDVTVGACVATVVMKGNTALRRAPGGKRIRWLHYGDELQVLCFSDEWVLTKQGYVKAECVEINW